MEDRLGKKMSEEFEKVNNDLKGLTEKLTILGKKVKDLEREKTRRDGWESEWDEFESVEVVGEKSGDKEGKEEDRREKEETEKNNSVEDEEESDDFENQETKVEQEEQTLVEEDDGVEAEQEEQTLVEEDDGVEKEEEEQTLVEEVDGVEKEQVTNMVVFVGDVFVDDVFLQPEPEVVVLGWKEEGEGSQPAQHVDKKGSRKIRTPRLTRNNLPLRFKTNMTPDGRRKKEKPKRAKQTKWRLERGRGLKENKLMWCLRNRRRSQRSQRVRLGLLSLFTLYF